MSSHGVIKREESRLSKSLALERGHSDRTAERKEHMQPSSWVLHLSLEIIMCKIFDLE